MTQEEFIEKANQVHHNKYQYDKVVYKNTKTLVEIYCPVHNIYFFQKPEKHLIGQGCNICGIEASRQSKIQPFEVVLKELQEKRPEYDYSLIQYKDTITDVDIKCEKHGIFRTTLYKLLKCNYKCPDCKAEENELKRQNDEKSFIEKAQVVHNGKYDYRLVHYEKAKGLVNIICKEHGVFKMQPLNHLMGKGCIVCGHLSSNQKRSLGIDELKERVAKSHRNISVLSEDIKTTKDKILCNCEKHGEFWIDGKSLLRNKYVCRKCYIESKMTPIDEMIEKFKQVHHDKYDYSEVGTERKNNRVCIICREHGKFYISPNDHLRGRGCQKCGRRSAALKKTKTIEQFIQDAIAVHGDVYDYSKVVYQGITDKIEIICKEHGSFWQLPSNHLKRQGCPSCFGNVKYTTEGFIKRCEELYVGRYEFKNIVCNSYYDNIEVICKKHGIFKTMAGSILNGRGCPKCKSSKGELEIIRYLESSGIKYEYQKKFPDLRDKQPLSYDFYLPNLNLLIEYNGIQHYKPIKIWGGRDAFLRQKHHDWLKRKYAQDNNISLVVIQYGQSVKNTLDELLNTL